MPPSPQIEDGHVKIANELYDAIFDFHFTLQQMRALFGVIRLTYGWRKKSDVISASQVAQAAKMDRGHAARALQELAAMNVITRAKIGQRYRIGVQKDYSLWQPLTDAESASKLMPNRHTPKTKDRKDKEKKIRGRRLVTTTRTRETLEVSPSSAS